MNFWQGDKVRLRAIEPADAEFFIRWNQDSERARGLDFLWPPTSTLSVKRWAEEQSVLKMEDGTYNWMIDNLAGEPVGSINSHHCNPRTGTFSYGIDIAADHRRKGYAAEAIFLLLKYYFEELRYQKVTVPVFGNNTPSIRLHERLGFRLEGTLRRMVFSGGRFHDELWFGLTLEEYAASPYKVKPVE